MTDIETGSIEFDIEARERHVVGPRPRVAPLPNDEVDADSRALSNRVRASAGAGPIDVLPEHMRIMVKHPELFRCQMETGSAIFHGKVPFRERELAVLRIGWLARAPYEWGEHVDIGRRCGLESAEIERVTRGSSAAGWNEHDAAIIRGAEELFSDQAVSDKTWNVLSKRWTEPQLIEFLVTVGQYLALAMLQNSLRVPLASSNPGLNHR
jgi:4-carboxymuconolactone decarboxylase